MQQPDHGTNAVTESSSLLSPASGIDDIVTHLCALEGRRCQAISESDFDTLGGLLSETLTHTHVTGTTQDRATYLAALGDSPRSTTHGELSVRVIGPVAIMTGPLRNTFGPPGGSHQGSEIAALRIWEHQADGHWRLSAFAASGPMKTPEPQAEEHV